LLTSLRVVAFRYVPNAYNGERITEREEGTMTDDRRPVETATDSLAALYRIVDDARSYQGYAEAARRAYDEELADFFREVREESRRRAERAGELLGQRLANGGVH
jgi:hypothetical protein